MDSTRGVKRLLLGIQLTVLGGVLVLAASGSAGAIGPVVAGAGFVVALTGMASDRRA